MRKPLCILGSTGSIGTQALSLLHNLDYDVVALSTNRRIDVLEEQIRQFHPKTVCVVDPEMASLLKASVSDCPVKVLSGASGLLEMIHTFDSNTLVLNAIVGMAGLQPTLAAVSQNCTIALANKESLVTGGQLVMQQVKERNLSLLPVDSEHSAIFQCIQDPYSSKSISRILLTASGGPYFGYKRDQLESVTLDQTLHHPNWSMGNKITVDSATMMNKAFELMEAMWLFGLTQEQVTITVHRQSILHSAVEFIDGAIIGQFGAPDMRIPIQYALTYPNRRETDVKRLSIKDLSVLTFEEPDYQTFDCLHLGSEAAKRGGLSPTIVNAANEVAVSHYLQNEISFLNIGHVIEYALLHVTAGSYETLEELLQCDNETRRVSEEYIKTIKRI